MKLRLFLIYADPRRGTGIPNVRWPFLPSCPFRSALNPRVHQRCGVYAFSMSGGQHRQPNCPPRDATKQGAGVRQLPPGQSRLHAANIDRRRARLLPEQQGHHGYV